MKCAVTAIKLSIVIYVHPSVVIVTKVAPSMSSANLVVTSAAHVGTRRLLSLDRDGTMYAGLSAPMKRKK